MTDPNASAEIRGLVDRMTAWNAGSGPESDVVLSSRVRRARNLLGVAFPQRASEVERERVFGRVVEAAREIEALRPLHVWNVDRLGTPERRLLVERHLVSPNLVQGEGARGLAVRDDEALGVMVNEEDHLRLQAVVSGLDLETALARAVDLDRALETRLEFATSPERGYLTACPTNVGTGLRASILVHLPALVLVGEIKKVHRAVNELGMIVRGWFGEGSSALGDFFQLSNQKTLGKTEPESCGELLRVARRVLKLEEEARERFRESPSMMRRIEDRVGRSWGILRHARLLSEEQLMACVSDLRLGRSLGRFDALDVRDLNRITLFAGSAHLRFRLGADWNAESETWERALWVRGEIERKGASWN